MVQQINLYNPLFRRRRAGFDACAMARLLGVAVLGLVLLHAWGRYQLGQVELRAQAAQKRLAQDQAQLLKLAAEFGPRPKSKLLEDELKAAEAGLARRRALKEAFEGAALGGTDGFSGYMRAFARRVVDGLWLTGFTVDGAAVSLSGRVLEPDLVPRYLERLAKEPLMQGAHFDALRLSRPEAPAGAKKEPPAAWVEFELVSGVQAAPTGKAPAVASGSGR